MKEGISPCPETERMTDLEVYLLRQLRNKLDSNIETKDTPDEEVIKRVKEMAKRYEKSKTQKVVK